MTFTEWWSAEGGMHRDPFEVWNAAIEAAAALMLAQGVSASEFYATELRKLKEPA